MTATAFATLTVKTAFDHGAKMRVISCVGPTSYSTGGATLDLSSGSTDGLGNKYDGFVEVYSVSHCGIGAAADSKYKCTYIPAGSGAAATGLVKINDVTATSGAEVTAATDLHTSTFYFLVIGR